MSTIELEADPLAGEDWATWLSCIVPSFCTHPMAAHHVEFWDWLWAVEPGVRPPASINVWARGGAKSTSAEAGVVALGARRKRRYGLYVCDTQDRADDHVGNIAAMLESERLEIFYPTLAERRVGKHGNSKGWRRNRLWTTDRFVVDAIGLDTAARGVKLEDQRPDFMVIDDIDGVHDTEAITKKKIETLTQSVLPAGAEDLAVLAIQNLIHPNGVFAQLADGRADFLRRRVVSGPVPAVEGLVTEYNADEDRDVIIAGTATWPGQSIERCQEMIDDWGLTAFLREAQHEVADVAGALWSKDQIEASRVADHPDLSLLVVSVDPSGGKGAGHDAQGIVAVGLGDDGDAYVLEDATCSLSPMGWGRRAVTVAVDLNADVILVEDNYGGEAMLNTVTQAAAAMVREGVPGAERFTSSAVKPVNAQLSKADRAHPIAALYGQKERPETWPNARVHHVGPLPELEREQRTWDPALSPKSPNRVDALVHGVDHLKLVARRGGRRRSIVSTGVAA